MNPISSRPDVEVRHQNYIPRSHGRSEVPELLESRIAPASLTWNGSVSDDWFVPENWTPNGVPGANDTATLGIASTINLTTPATVGSFTQTAGTLTGSAILSISSTFIWSGGTEAGAGTTFLQPDSVLQISGAAVKTLAGRTLNIFGTTTWTGTGNIIFDSGEIRNQPSGFFDIQTDADLIDSDGTGTSAVFMNNGILYKTFGALGSDATEFIDVTFADAGPTAVASGELRLAGPGSASNAFIEIAADAQLTIKSHFAFLSGSLFTNSGTFLIANGGTFDTAGALALGGTFILDLGGTLTGTGDISFDGTASWTGGTMSGSGKTTISAGGTLEIADAGGTPLSRAVVNDGTLNLHDGLTFGGGFTQTGGATNLFGGTYALNGAMNLQGGTLTGSGTISGSVANSGATIQPSGTGAIGVIDITGNYTQTGGALEIDVGGTTARQAYDQVTVGGTATLGGALNVALVSGFLPSAGDTFPILTHQTSGGSFATLNLPAGLTGADLPAAYTLTGVALPNIVTTELDVVDANDNVVSLREAILYANSHPGFDSILFNIPGAGVHTLAVTTALPTITETVVINGYSQHGASANTLASGNDAVLQIELHNGGTVENGFTIAAGEVAVRGFSITGFTLTAVIVQATGLNAVIAGNFIGLTPAGTGAGNGEGVRIDGAANAMIGGLTPADRNVISGNHASGILFLGSTAVDGNVQGNFIGTNAAGTAALANSAGVAIMNGAHGAIIGGIGANAGNLIAFNQTGIYVGPASRGEILLGNSVQANVFAQIDLDDDGPTPNDGGTPPDTDTGANDLQNYPIISSAVIDANGLHFRGSLASTPNTTFRLEFFEKSAVGAGGVLLPTFLDFKTVTTDAQGFASFDFLSSASAQLGDQIVVTATDMAGAGTSELAPAVVVTPPPPSISIADGIVVEGSAGTTALVFTLTLDHAQPGVPVTVNFTTSDFTAHAGSDYTAKSGVVTFAPGEIQQTITIDVTGDTLAESRERFHLTLSDPAYATIGTGAASGIIQDDDHHFTAAGSGHGGRIGVFQTTSSSATQIATLQPFGAGYKGGVRVAVGDVNGDGTDDFAAGASSNKNGRVRIFDGSTMLPFVDASHAAFANLDAFPGYRGGIFVAVGDVNGDGFGDLIVSTSSGRSNMVKVFSGADATLFATFQAFGGSAAGVRVAAGDVNGDGYADIVAGSGNGSAVKVFDIHDQPATPVVLQSFDRVFAKSYTGGVLVAVGDLADATHLGAFDGTDDLIVSAGKSRPNVRILPDLSTAPAQTILAYARPFHGVRVATADVNGDGIADLLAGQGTDGSSRVSVLSGLDFTKLFNFSLRPKSNDGVYVG
jgi:hypothetical protein